MTELNVDQCASCHAEDNHPKYLVIGATQGGLGWETYHHDCAALLGHEKASVIVEQTKGAKGDELRSVLTDPDHSVHAAVADFNAKEAERISTANLRQLGGSE